MMKTLDKPLDDELSGALRRGMIFFDTGNPAEVSR